MFSSPQPFYSFYVSKKDNPVFLNDSSYKQAPSSSSAPHPTPQHTLRLRQPMPPRRLEAALLDKLTSGAIVGFLGFVSIV